MNIRQEYEDRYGHIYNTRYLAFCYKENINPVAPPDSMVEYILFIDNIANRYKKLQNLTTIISHDHFSDFVWSNALIKYVE